MAMRSTDARNMDDSQIPTSLFLIGAALALAGIVGVFQPPGHRGGVLLALLAGIGVGISGLALSWSSLENGNDHDFWRVFLNSSIAGFITVIGALVATWWRGHRPSGLRARP